MVDPAKVACHLVRSACSIYHVGVYWGFKKTGGADVPFRKKTRGTFDRKTRLFRYCAKFCHSESNGVRVGRVSKILVVLGQ